ncbi:hypothetical protein HZF02_33165 (plasmid) [Pseudomonas yamanorum]|nr:hypothetical protein HZF02_33165 [Pseudomonas yamanorum]
MVNLTTMVAEGLHDRSRSQQNFPATDDAQFKVESASTPNTSDHPVWLAVPHDAREAAREATGKLENGQSAIGWDKEASLWFARPGADLDRIAQWLPDTSNRSGGGDPEAEFLDALTREGLVLQGRPIMDGQRHRVSTVEDKKGTQSGVYRGFLDRKEQNKGLLMATAAAEQIGGQVLYPAFTDDEKAGGLTDFNDLHQSRGLDALHSQIAPVLVNDNEVPIMQEEKAALDPAATSAFVDSVLPLAAPAPLIYTHNGEPVTIDLARFQPPRQVEPPAAPVEPESSVALMPLTFTHNGEPASLGWTPDPAIALSPESLGAEWTANQLERLNARAATEQSVFAEVEGLLKNQKFELRAQISALRKDDTGPDSDTVKGHKSTIRAIDQALKEMRQQRNYDGDPSHLSLLDRFKYGQVGDKQGITQGRGLDGSLRDEWVKQQLQQPGSPKGFLVVEDGRQFQVERTARTEALLSRVLVLGSNAGVTELIRGEIGVRHAERNTVAVPAFAEEHAPTVVQRAALDNKNLPGAEARIEPRTCRR